jgi:hypothetical protein
MEITPVHLCPNTAAGTDWKTLFNPGRKFELVGVRFGSVDGITGHASNYGDLSVLGSDASTAVWLWSTASAAEGSVTAGSVYYTSDEEAPGVAGDTAQDFESAATKTLLTFDADQALEVVNDQSNGTGVAFPDTGLTLLIRYL